ncbi:MAG: hypothetical protein OH338_04720 [Candidatus Parvarchaeota archaeon]|nr:hypothetical protein [Candidatus Parvarchaeota archaeon]MCW1295962.1 hypothetical protein [Candidatus Parvarchaeum tengchongense]MCW1298834.1 hypothetical protein [Candidatus Parvarchaeum tengchongense]MCW1312701.1 hypothetical protein [Candidatus Parvarchaeum tengchongense]
MELENESRKQMKSRLYSLLADKRKKDRLSDYNAFSYKNKDYSFEVKLKDRVEFDEVSRMVEKAAEESNLKYARLGFVNTGAEFGFIYLKQSKISRYLNKLFFPLSGNLENMFITTNTYASRGKMERINLTCSNPKAHKKEFVDFFLNLYKNIYKERNVTVEEYIE